eukprot:4922704-Amphidinium_carterae.6
MRQAARTMRNLASTKGETASPSIFQLSNNFAPHHLSKLPPNQVCHAQAQQPPRQTTLPNASTGHRQSPTNARRGAG